MQVTATASPDSVTDPSVNWTSSDENVATVDEEGLITALNKGNTTITATAKMEVRRAFHSLLQLSDM